MVSSNTQTFSVKGLPYISKNFSGDKYSATRHKIRKWVEKEFSIQRENIKRIYVNIETGDIQFTIDTTNWSKELSNMIRKSPSGEIFFSWEQTIKDRKTEKDWLQPYKSSLYLTDMYSSYDSLKTNREIVTSLYKEFDYPLIKKYLEDREFEEECEMFLLQSEIDEILCEEDEGNNLEDAFSFLSISNKKRERGILMCSAEDLEVEPPYKRMNVSDTYVSEYEVWTPEKICEKIRFLNVCGKINISFKDVDVLTKAFGQKRVIE